MIRFLVLTPGVSKHPNLWGWNHHVPVFFKSTPARVSRTVVKAPGVSENGKDLPWEKAFQPWLFQFAAGYQDNGMWMEEDLRMELATNNVIIRWSQNGVYPILCAWKMMISHWMGFLSRPYVIKILCLWSAKYWPISRW